MYLYSDETLALEVESEAVVDAEVEKDGKFEMNRKNH